MSIKFFFPQHRYKNQTRSESDCLACVCHSGRCLSNTLFYNKVIPLKLRANMQWYVNTHDWVTETAVTHECCAVKKKKKKKENHWPNYFIDFLSLPGYVEVKHIKSATVLSGVWVHSLLPPHAGFIVLYCLNCAYYNSYAQKQKKYYTLVLRTQPDSYKKTLLRGS